MKRLINVRPSLFCVISIILGVISAVEFIYGQIVLSIVCAVLFCASIVVFAVLKNKLWIIASIMFVAFLFGLFYVTIYQYVSTKNEIVEKQTTIVGRVTDIGRNGKQNNVLYLENCVCQDDGTKLSGRVSMPVYDGSSFSAGDIVTASGILRSTYVFKNKVNVSGIRNRVYYRFSVASISSEEGSLTFAEKVRKYIYQTSTDYAGENSGIVYALLTGDRNAISDETTDVFNSAGIIHLLAVSGLHVGVIVAVFAFLLKFFKLNPFVELAILILPLSFYAYLCGFSPSVVRAVLMLCCLYVSKALFGKYDLLTSLCWACLIILTVSPLTLYDVGFQLSALSVLGITTVYKPLSNKFAKAPRFLRYFCNSLCVSFSCIFATLFCMWHYFGKVSLLGLFTNLFAVPLMSIVLVVSLVGMLPWVFHYILFIADKIVALVKVVVEWATGLQLVVSADAFAVSVLLTVLFLLLLGGYINLEKIAKRIAIVVCAAVLCCTTIFATIPQNCKNQIKVFNGYDDNCIVATASDNEVYVVCDFCDEYQTNYVNQYVSKLRYSKIVLLIPHYSNCQVELLSSFCNNLTISKVYKLNTSSNSGADAYFEQKSISVSNATKNRVVQNVISFQPVFDGELRSVVLSVGDLSVATVYGDENSIRNFVDMRSDIDAYVMETVPQTIVDRKKTTFTLYQQQIDGNFGANKYGNFTLKEKDGKIILSFR